MKLAIFMDSSVEPAFGLEGRIYSDENPGGNVFIAPLHTSYYDGTMKEVDDGKLEPMGGIDWLISEMQKAHERGSDYPKTSQATPGDIAPLYEQALAAGFTHGLGLFLPFPLSQTRQSAVTAMGMVDGFDEHNLYLPFMKTASLGTTYVWRELDQALRAGADYEAARAIVKNAMGQVYIVIVPMTLDYLHAGGRIGKAKHLVGSLLRFKPMLTLTQGDEVEIILRSTPRTWGRVYSELVEIASDYEEAGIVTAGNVSAQVGDAESRSTVVYALNQAGVKIDTIQPATSAAVVANVGPCFGCFFYGLRE